MTVEKAGGAQCGAPDDMAAFLASLSPEQRERLTALLNAPPVPR